ncbi:MAG: (2Fe-2S)-binding protein [Thermodesulfobacteriota bacterium]
MVGPARSACRCHAHRDTDLAGAEPHLGPAGLTRRGFMTALSAGAVGLAAGGGSGHAAPVADPPAESSVRVRLQVNGRYQELLVEPRWSLLFVLRERLGLTGTKVGCGRGECGACTVLLEGVPRYACLTLAVEAQGFEVTTVEGLLRGEELGPTQQAFAEHDAFQCGYCTPGQIMAVEGLLRQTPEPSPAEIRRGVSGNLCRCGAYANIFRAAERAAELKRGGGG